MGGPLNSQPEGRRAGLVRDFGSPTEAGPGDRLVAALARASANQLDGVARALLMTAAARPGLLWPGPRSPGGAGPGPAGRSPLWPGERDQPGQWPALCS